MIQNVYGFDQQSVHEERFALLEWFQAKHTNLQFGLSNSHIMGWNIPPTALVVMAIQAEAFTDGYRAAKTQD